MQFIFCYDQLQNYAVWRHMIAKKWGGVYNNIVVNNSIVVF